MPYKAGEGVDKQEYFVTLETLIQGRKVNTVWCGHGREAQQATRWFWLCATMDSTGEIGTWSLGEGAEAGSGKRVRIGVVVPTDWSSKHTRRTC